MTYHNFQLDISKHLGLSKPEFITVKACGGTPYEITLVPAMLAMIKSPFELYDYINQAAYSNFEKLPK